MKQVQLLDICFPDYFTGYHLPVLSIPVFGTMTNKDIADAIDSYLDVTWEYINPEDNEEITALYDAYIAKLNADPDAVFCELDEVGEDQECCYAYFSIINPVTVHGITFLNP